MLSIPNPPTKLFLFILVAVLGGCSSEPKPSANSATKTDSSITVTPSESISDEEAVTYKLPSPLQLAAIFKKSGVKFVEGFANSPDNVVKYKSGNFIRAINLGIYSSDLAYAILNKKSQESKKYLKACMDISTELGLKKAFENNGLAVRFDRNINKEDSLLVIISDIQMQIDILLEENKQKHITAIAFAGAWIESVYIAGKLYDADKNKTVGNSLMEQFYFAENIIKALKANENREPECKLLIENIGSIMDTFKNFGTVKTLLSKQEEPDFSTVSLTADEFKTLENKISEVRTALVK
jgi:hypothetical protein